MASIGTALKREGVTQAWNILIQNITGEAPYISRSDKGNHISWKPGQAKKMENYLSKAMQGKEAYDPNALNVSVDMSPVLLPLAVKKSYLWVGAYTILVGLIAFKM